MTALTRVTLQSGIELDVLDEGPRDAPVLLFLHGFPESHVTWRHQIARFAKDYRCIAPDQRGYCGSSKPQEVSAYDPALLIADVFQLANALGVEKFTVVGHDWGGVIAWGVAHMGQANGMVERAVIANAPHPELFQTLLHTNPVQREASQYITAFRDPANDELVKAHGLAALLLKALKGGLSDKLEPEVRDAQFVQWQDREAAFAMLNWYRATPVVVPPLDAPYALPEGWQAPALPPLTIPTLVVWAMDDRALPPCNLDGLEEIVPNLTLCPVHGCGHFVTWEDPEALNGAMAAFLSST